MKTGDIGADPVKEIVPIAEAGVPADMRVEQGTEMEVGVLVEGVPTGSTARLCLEGASSKIHYLPRIGRIAKPISRGPHHLPQ